MYFIINSVLEGNDTLLVITMDVEKTHAAHVLTIIMNLDTTKDMVTVMFWTTTNVRFADKSRI